MKNRLALRRVDRVFIWFFTIVYPLLCGSQLFLFHWLPQWAWHTYISQRTLELQQTNFYHLPRKLQILWKIFERMTALQGPVFRWTVWIITGVVLAFIFYLLLARPKIQAALLAFALPFSLSRLLLWLIDAAPTGFSDQFAYGKWHQWYLIELFPYGYRRLQKIFLAGVLLYGFQQLLLYFVRRYKQRASGPL